MIIKGVIFKKKKCLPALGGKMRKYASSEYN